MEQVNKSIHQPIQQLCAITLLCCWLVACAVPDAAGLKTSPMADNPWDINLVQATQNEHENLILVTMTNAVHDGLVYGDGILEQDGLPLKYSQFLTKLTKYYSIKRIADWPLKTLNIRCLVFEARDQQHRDAAIAQLASEPYVESAQALQYFGTLATTSKTDMSAPYNDPFYNLQHGFDSMQTKESHRWATGKGVKVAVIDTGLDSRHTDLRDHIIEEKNFVNRNTDEFRKDIHGTAVAGLIAAVANNGTGMVGVAPDANIVALKACWQTESASRQASCNSFTLAKALNFAISQQVDIINLSLAGPQDPLLERLLRTAMEHNIVVVGAVNPKKINAFPAYVAGVIAVSESERQYRGAELNAFVKAPGKEVLSASPGDEYKFYTGSSFSTAHIAGLSALLRQRDPDLSGDEIAALLNATSGQESGSVNACKAISYLVSEGNC